MDVARLAVQFDTIHDLVASAAALHGMNHGSQLAWVDNKFHHPSPVGYADINVGFKVQGFVVEVTDAVLSNPAR